MMFVLEKEARMIELVSIRKTFKVALRDGGLRASLKAFGKREYRTITALDDVSFHVNEGEIVGYIGPNGAGKSSTIKIMCGILSPDEGMCTVNGIDPFKNRKEHAKNIGVVFGQRSQLWWDIAVIDSFDLIRDIYAIPVQEYKTRLEELVVLLNLQDIIRTPTRQLSLGQRMRCEIAASLLHNPKVLFLDEPTIGLDAVSKIAVRSFIKKINQKYKTTVILTTHDMQDIESLANRVILIGKGKILLDGTLADLKQRYRLTQKIALTIAGGSLPSCEGLVVEIQDEHHLSLTLDLKLCSLAFALEHISAHVEVLDLQIESSSLDSIILDLYEEFKI